MSQCTESGYQQVSGGSCSLTMYPEAAPGCVEPGERGVKLAFMSESFARGSSKQPRSVITGKRGGSKPREGLPQSAGSVQAAASSPQLGYLLRALCGAPLSVAEPSRTLDAAAVVELDLGLVGLPCAAHGFVQDAVITIYGTQNYDGSYRVARGVMPDIIAIAAPYVAEALPADAMAYRGRAPILEGAAQHISSGLVGLPVKGGAHGLNPGEGVVIEGSTNYDGTHVLQPGTEGGLLVISAAYTGESFDGTLVAVPLFYKHSFALPKRQPTVCMEKYLDFEDGAAVNKYRQFGFCKVNGFNFNFGGDEELSFALDFAVGRESAAPTPLDAAPLTPPFIPLESVECALWVAGVRRGDVESGSFTNSFGVTPKAAVGDLGEYSRMAEGDPQNQATLNAFLEVDDYEALARARATVPFALSICGSAGDEAWFNYPESELDVPGTPINGKEGLMQEVTVMAFVDKGDTVFTAELVNRVASYAL